MIGNSKKSLREVRNLDQVYHICYPIVFKINTQKVEIMALINFENKINIINFAYMANYIFKSGKPILMFKNCIVLIWRFMA